MRRFDANVDIEFIDYSIDDPTYSDEIKNYKPSFIWINYNPYNNLLIGSGCYGQSYLYQFDHNLNLKKRQKQPYLYATVMTVQNGTGNYLFSSWRMNEINVYDCDFNFMYYVDFQKTHFIENKYIRAQGVIECIHGDVMGNIYSIFDYNRIGCICQYNEKGIYMKHIELGREAFSIAICDFKRQIITADLRCGLLQIYDSNHGLQGLSTYKIYGGGKYVRSKMHIVDNVAYIKYDKDIYCYDMRKLYSDIDRPIDIINVNCDPSDFTIMDGRLLISKGNELFYK